MKFKSKTDWNNLKEAFSRQKEYSKLFFNEKYLSQKEKEEITKTFILSLHAEASELISAINLKDHRLEERSIDKDKILFKSVDIFRYILSTLNLWNISAEQFADACEDKDLFLFSRHRITQNNAIVKSDGNNNKTIIFDIDDVIAEFRTSYNDFLFNEFGIKSDPKSKQYYNIADLIAANIHPDFAFNQFVAKGGFKNLDSNNVTVEILHALKKAGFKIHLLTARPSENLKCFYDTFAWVELNKIPYDNISFSKEKYLWLSSQDFYRYGEVLCAFEDSSKHADEYAKHGVKVIVPARHYNEDVEGKENIFRINFDDSKNVMKKFSSIFELFTTNNL